MSDNGQRALALATLGLHVFPCWESGDFMKAPRTEHGFLEATTDPGQIQAWWQATPEALIGVAAGASGLNCQDIDHKPEKNGSESLAAAGHWPPEPTYWYETQSGGFHFIYAAEGPAVGPTKDHKLEDGTKLLGVDRRSGGSYFIWWDEAWPDSRDEFRPAPAWFSNSVASEVGDEWGGTLAEWFNTIGGGRPNALMESVIANKIPRTDFGRAELWSRMVHIIRLAGEGNPGAGVALTELMHQWLRPPWNQPKYQTEWNVSLGNAVGANGGLTEKSAELVTTAQALTGYEFFDSSPELVHIRTWAQAQLVNPWAALLTVLTRLSADLPPSVQLPRLGSLPKGSLNQFSILAGPSGAGKSALITGVDESLWPRPSGSNEVAKRFSPSTGEGLIAHFVERQKQDGEWRDVLVETQAYAAIDEIDSLEALAGRSGSILLSNLKLLWTGSYAGSGNATQERRRSLPAHSYRLALIAGVQPGLGQVLFSEESAIGGLPQRFVFATVQDPTLSRSSFIPEDPGALHRAIPPSIPFSSSFYQGGHEPMMGEVHVLPVDHTIVAEMLDMQIAIKLGEEGNALKGHWMLAKLKVAALLSILHGATTVTVQWWEGAQRVMEHSDATRDMLIDTLQRAANRENIARGKGDAERLIASESTIMNRTADRIVTILREHPGMLTSQIKTQLARSMRQNADAALQILVDQGRIAQQGDHPTKKRGAQWTVV